MRKGGGSFPGSGFGRKSTVGSNASNRAALDHDLDSILSDDLQGTASQPLQKSKTSVKKGSLTSGTTDEDFYSSLAQMAGEGFDEDDDDESISEADAKKMADNLAGLDDMESDLFGGSLGRNATPSKVSKPAKTSLDTKNTAKPGRKPSEDSSNLEKSNRGKDISPEPAKPNAKVASSLDQDMDGTKPKTAGNPRKRYDFGEFDEDDPLAGLLSDEEDYTVSKPKRKTAEVGRKTKSTETSSQGLEMERPKSSRGRQPANQERAISPSPPATPENQPTVRKEKNANKGTTSPPVSPRADVHTDSSGKDSGSPRRTPQSREREISAQKAKPSKDEIKFDSDEDLPGLDDPDKTSRDTPIPPAKAKQERTSGRNSPGSSGDIFDDDDDLPDTGTRSESPSRQSRFSELLGRKEKDDSKKQVPKSLDDFMANISSKGNTGSGAGNKKVTSPTSDESFQFGGYMPSAASSGPSHSRGGLARPDTAPSSSRRTVRFSDELGLDDDLFGRERPSSAPSDRLSRRQQRENGGETNKGAKPPSGRASSKMQSEDIGEIKTKATNETDSQKIEETPPSIGVKPSGGGGGDWLGLGEDDGDSKSLELSNASLKSSSSFSNDIKKDTPETQGPPERQERQSSPPRRAGRYRGREGGNSDEFLRMLGITPDEQPKSRQAETWDNEKSSLFPRQSSGGSPKRGKRWPDQTSQQSSLDEPDNAAPLKEPTDRSNVSTHLAGPLQEDKADSKVVKRQVSVNQDTQRPPQFQTLISRQPQGQEHSQSPQYPAMEHALSSSTPGPFPPPEATPMQTGVYPGTQASPPQPILPQTTNVSPQIGPQVYPTHLYYSQSQPASLASQIVQDSSQSLGFRPHYPIGLQVPGQTPLSSFSPSTPQLSSVERLEMTKLKAESELQHGRLMEYQVASEHQEQQKTRLEEEVKELVERVQGIEVDRHKRDLEAASKISECEGKIRRLELERDQLLTTIEALKTRHKDELSNIDTAHKSHLKALEESYQRREQRLKEETDLIVAQNSEKFKTLETEKADLQASNSRKVAILETAKTNEINSLKEIHRRAMEQLRQEHEDEIAQLRRLKEQEVSAATSAHAHTKSLQSLMDQVLSSTREVSTLRQKIEVTHKSGLEERELSTRARDEYLKQMQERLLRQQSENDEERARLQGLVAKMELHMREQTRQVDQERWRTSQEESRLRALQAALEDERRITMEQLSLQRAEVERARDDLVREQRTTMSQIQEERRTLATERAQLSSAHKDLISREKLKTETSVQAESDLGVTAIRIKEDAVALSVREAQLKQGEEKLKREKQEFERRRCGFDEERDRIGKLGLEVQKRSREIEELCSEAAQVRDEGEQALELAERVRTNAESQRAEAEGMFLVIQEKERQLAQDRISIAHERRLLEKDKRTGRCWQCEGRQLSSADQTQGIDSLGSTDSSNPFNPSSSTTPDLLINSLELKRTLRKWSKDKEKDEEFLEQEAQFLSQLHGSGERS